MNKTEKRIRDAAITLIARVGYPAMSLRLLTRESGINSSTLYMFFRGKQDLLATLVMHYYQQRSAAWDDNAPADHQAVAQMQAFIAFHVRYHLTHRDEAMLGTLELRSLDLADQGQVRQARRRYLEKVQGLLERGVAQGAMRCEEPKLTARIIVGLLTQACAWYSDSGQMGIDEVIVCYTRLVLNMLEVSLQPTCQRAALA